MKTGFLKTIVSAIGKKIAIGGMQVSVGALAAVAVTGTVAIGGGGYYAYETFHAAAVAEADAARQADELENLILNEGVADNTGQPEVNTPSGINDPVLETEPNIEDEIAAMEDVHTHTWTEQVVTDSTCSATGLMQYVCDDCGYSYQDTLSMKEHTPSDWVIVSEATVHADGMQLKECTTCGTQLAVETIPVIPCTHNYRADVVSSPTCESDGLTRYECSVCGSTYNETQSATGHDYHTDSTSAASCDKEGHIYSKCSNCGKTIETGTIGKTPHKYGEYVTEKEAACEEDGLKTRKCENCETTDTLTLPKTGHYWAVDTVEAPTCVKDGHGKATCSNEDCGAIDENYVIPATGHTAGQWVEDKAPTCTENGSQHTECTVCKETVETEVIPATGHAYEESGRKESTCSEKGNIQYTCSTCGDTYETAVDMKSHTPSDKWETEKASTCSEAGVEVRTCLECGARLTETRPIEKLPHSYKKDTKEATCTTDGYTRDKCEVCGEIANTEALEKLGHNWTNGSSAEPTCTENGHQYDGQCSRCGEKAERKEIPATGHSYKWIITKEASCSEAGTQEYTCNTCGNVERTQSINKTPHIYGEWIVRTEPTEDVKGLKVRTCKNCSTEDTQDIPVLPHVHNYSTRVDEKCVKVTCEASGKEIYACRCGNLYEETIPATGHDYNMVSKTEPNCVMDGAENYECQNEECDSAYANVLSATGHSAGDWNIVKAATDLEEGLKIKSCTTCSEELERNTIAKLDHICSFDTLIEEQKATCTTDGFTVSQCRCTKTEREIISKTNHANKTWKTTKEASYTETGLKEEICDDCHTVVNTEVIPVVAHECQYEKVDEKLATCTESGYQTVSCSFCGASKTVTSNPLGHKEGSMSVTKQATCLEGGEQTANCINCGILLKTETIPATGHSASGWITDSEAGCETNGSMHVECTVCHAELEKSTISATGHHMGGWKVELSASCETDGTEKNSCSSCNNTETRNIPATGHSYGDWIVDKEPTEEEEGLKHKECANCGNSITEDIEPIPPHVHSYSESDNTESTCTSAGSITYTCSGCGDYYSESKPMAEHTSGDWITKKEATESAEGLKVKECTACGTQTDSAVIEKLPHNHSYATDSKSPTCTEDGYEKQTCSCGSVINKVLPATGHKYGEAVVVDATCTKKGSSTITCSVCRHSEKTDIPMVEHVYVESSKTAATCTEAGNVTYTCNGCKGTKTETIDTLGHDYKLTSDIAATCTAGGYTIETCSNCMDTIRTEKGEMLGHDYTDEIITKEPELGVDGEKKICCKLCGDVKEIQKIDMLLTDGTDSVYKVKNMSGEEEILIGHIDEEMSQDMYERINAYRAENGQTELAIKASYEDYTIKRAYEIAHTFEHWHPNGGGLSGSLSENIAKGATSFQADPVGILFDAWKASDGHNRNMLGASYKNTCVKMFALKDPIHGHYIYHCVQVFSSR